MRTCTYASILGMCVAATVAAQAPNANVERHIAAARAAAGEHMGMVDRLCPMPGVARPVQGNRTAPPGVPARDSWHAEPAKVFDNLYFVGMTEFSAWAVTTSAGIIVIDPLFDYSVEDEVVGGLRKLGLDPADIEYVLDQPRPSRSRGRREAPAGAVRRARAADGRGLGFARARQPGVEAAPRHRDHGRAEAHARRHDADDALHAGPHERHGVDADSRARRRRAHVAALWGGTLFNFGPDAARFAAYAASALKFRELAAAAGADVLLSNHTDYDGTKEKLPALATRAPGAPHPYVVGSESIRRYLTVANECAQAALASVQ